MGIITSTVSCDFITIATTIFVRLQIDILELEPPTLSPTIPLDDVKKVLLGLITFGEQFQEFRKNLNAEGTNMAGFMLSY
ncbi:hypothetical protein BDFB_013090 [Asbolus verrucosus]|uniref:Uncharacterized protein n=1 Tax=Asbolus verrucosus TaxID=1661398 RepID=A0A482W7J0_ASBVE|nr:hypothetical protein BDFB_013090 [Asbolus verrucosus]